jgi:hypothetical protein
MKKVIKKDLNPGDAVFMIKSDKSFTINGLPWTVKEQEHAEFYNLFYILVVK